MFLPFRVTQNGILKVESQDACHSKMKSLLAACSYGVNEYYLIRYYYDIASNASERM